MPDTVKAIYNESDNLLTVSNATVQSDGSTLTGATITARVLNSETGAEVVLSSGTWPVDIVETATPGDYAGILPDVMELLPPDVVDVEVVIEGGADKKRTKVFRRVKVKES